MEVTAKFLEMLLAGASREDLDLVVAEAEVSGSTPEQLAALREQHALALRLREQLERHQSREAQLTALYETANDLIGIRWTSNRAILTAIVRRARQLLNADMTYLSLNDRARGRVVHEGHLRFIHSRSPQPPGSRSAPACWAWWPRRGRRTTPTTTSTYRPLRAPRLHLPSAVGADQGIRAILGVPLLVEGQVIGALLATHRTVRAFPADRGERSDVVRRARRGGVGERPPLRWGPRSRRWGGARRDQPAAGRADRRGLGGEKKSR